MLNSLGALLAYWCGLFLRFCHTTYHFLLLHWDDPPHYIVNDTRWRGDGSIKSLELRCTCGRLFYKWWTDQ